MKIHKNLETVIIFGEDNSSGIKEKLHIVFFVLVVLMIHIYYVFKN